MHYSGFGLILSFFPSRKLILTLENKELFTPVMYHSDFIFRVFWLDLIWPMLLEMFQCIYMTGMWILPAGVPIR